MKFARVMEDETENTLDETSTVVAFPVDVLRKRRGEGVDNFLLDVLIESGQSSEDTAAVVDGGGGGGGGDGGYEGSEGGGDGDEGGGDGDP